jgi:hypothetical protein
VAWHSAGEDLDVPADASYVFDLVSPYLRRRERALERHAGYLAAHRATIMRGNEIWEQAGRHWVPADPALHAAMDQVRAAGRDAGAHTVYGLAGMFVHARWLGGPDDRDRLAPYAVLLLHWESCFPQPWRDATQSSPWWLKKQVLRRFAEDGVPERHCDQMVKLLFDAVRREQRCEDGGYVALARRLDGPDLRAALAHAARSDDPLTQLRARYVLWVADHVDQPVTTAGWRRWLAQDG